VNVKDFIRTFRDNGANTIEDVSSVVVDLPNWNAERYSPLYPTRLVSLLSELVELDSIQAIAIFGSAIREPAYVIKRYFFNLISSKNRVWANDIDILVIADGFHSDKRRTKGSMPYMAWVPIDEYSSVKREHHKTDVFDIVGATQAEFNVALMKGQTVATNSIKEGVVLAGDFNFASDALHMGDAIPYRGGCVSMKRFVRVSSKFLIEGPVNAEHEKQQ
jgi:hypothetical protein